MLGSAPNPDSSWVVLQDLGSQIVAVMRDTSLLSDGKEILLCGSVDTVWGFLVHCNLVIRNRHLFSTCIVCKKLHMGSLVRQSEYQSVTVSVTEKYYPSMPSVMMNLNCFVAKKPPLLQPLH